MARGAWAGIALLVAAGCGGHGHDGGHDGHAHAAEGHHHAAPHGGTLVALGDEAAHVELLLDAKARELTAWLLDAEAERPLRSAQDALVLVLAVAGEPRRLRLEPVERELTGETAGDTSEFHLADPALGDAVLEGTIERVEVLGAAFEDVPIVAEGG